MQILNGKEVAAFHRRQILGKIEQEKEAGKAVPQLAILLIGDDAPSRMYAHSMQKAAEKAGLDAVIHQEAADVSEDELLSLLDRLNQDPKVCGILPMMPLPQGLDTRRVLDAIDPEKDVDGLTDTNIARLYSGRAGFVPCTPRAVMAILAYYQIDLCGKNVVIIGRSNVVGKPLFQLCLNKNATVTVCHTRTKDLGAVCRQADVLIAAAGKAGLVHGDMVKDGAVVIDVGINRVDGKTVGDVVYEEAAAKAASITPVPGGVGAVTTMMVLENVVCGTAQD